MKVSIFLSVLLFSISSLADSDLQPELPVSAREMVELQQITQQMQVAELVQQRRLVKAELEAMDDRALMKTLTGEKLPDDVQSKFEQFFKGCPDCRDVVIVTGSYNRSRRSNISTSCTLQCAAECQGESGR